MLAPLYFVVLGFHQREEVLKVPRFNDTTVNSFTQLRFPTFAVLVGVVFGVALTPVSARLVNHGKVVFKAQLIAYFADFKIIRYCFAVFIPARDWYAVKNNVVVDMVAVNMR